MTTRLTPYTEPAINTLYEMLFCDELALFSQNTTAPLTGPWQALLNEGTSEAALREMVADAGQPSRIRLLASQQLRSRGVPVAHELLGVIVELGLEGGLDVLAAFKDGTARYFNYTGKVLIWESPSPDSNAIINKLFAESQRIVSQIGLWRKPRKIFPAKGLLRISFLGTDGLYFGEGPIQVMFDDTMSAPAIREATALLQFLTSQQKN